ncbi:MAG: DUF2207 domain-containing protein, partial [Eubacteriaceae bacterium]|nr:DUF2207 domain-containing protein [Eubacteriaceae bacterium]
MFKKLIAAIFLVFIISSPVFAAVDNVDFRNTGYQIDAYVQEDGSMKVSEFLTYDGSFNGQFRDIIYSMDGIDV